MKAMRVSLLVGLVCLLCGSSLHAQQSAVPQSPSARASASVVPSLVRFSGVLKDEMGKPLTGTVGITFALYENQEGGAALWVETQNVRADANGNYTLLLGSTRSDGVSPQLFAAGQARWLGVQPERQPEMPRVLLTSVPYSLKAGDAQTLGGLPASAFLQAQPAGASPAVLMPAGTAATGAGATGSSASTAPLATIGGSGSPGTIPIFTAATTIGNSLITQSGGAAVVSEALQLPATGTATSTLGFNSQPSDLFASSFNKTLAKAVSQHFRWQAEPVGNDTTTPSGKVNLLYASGTGTPAETGLSISSKGLFSFAVGQTFPGTGTVTSVASGAGLTGGPITKTGTLSIASGGVTNTMLLHPSLTVKAGTGLSGGGAVALGGSVTLTNAGILGVGVGSGLTSTGGQTPTLDVNTTVVPELALSNFFTVPQFINGYLDAFPSGDSVALYGFNTSTDSTHPALYLENDDTTSAGDLVFQARGNPGGFGGNVTIDVSGNLFFTGTLSPVVRTPNNRQVGLYTVQSSENWIEDYGSGRLANGVATVSIRPDFAQTVSKDADYHVFLTPGGDCEGLYVTNKTASSFEVHELRNGKSNVQFDYRIAVHRRGYEAARLPDVTARFQTRVEMPKRRGASGVPK